MLARLRSASSSRPDSISPVRAGAEVARAPVAAPLASCNVSLIRSVNVAAPCVLRDRPLRRIDASTVGNFGCQGATALWVGNGCRGKFRCNGRVLWCAADPFLNPNDTRVCSCKESALDDRKLARAKRCAALGRPRTCHQQPGKPRAHKPTAATIEAAHAMPLTGTCGDTFQPASNTTPCDPRYGSGTWGGVPSLDSCVSLCRRCPFCNFISFSLRYDDCTYYSACELPLRRWHGGSSYQTVTVRSVSFINAVYQNPEEDGGRAPLQPRHRSSYYSPARISPTRRAIMVRPRRAVGSQLPIACLLYEWSWSTCQAHVTSTDVPTFARGRRAQLPPTRLGAPRLRRRLSRARPRRE